MRAVAALAPLGVVLSAASLASISVPTLLVEAEQDCFLVPRFHSGWVAQNLPQAQRIRVPNAMKAGGGPDPGHTTTLMAASSLCLAVPQKIARR